MKSPIIFSFFSGCGFLDLGFERASFNIEFVNENHIPFLEAYKYSRTQLRIKPPKYGYDSTSIESFLSGDSRIYLQKLVNNAKSKVNLVGFVGGPPCPDFSIGGKNKGQYGDNGKLTKVYVDIIIENQPDFFVFENVKGLWRTRSHRQFYENLKHKLSNYGYVLTDRLTNCIEFGVPQNRDRIIMFGIKKTLISRLNHQQSLYDAFKWDKYIKYDKNEVLNRFLWPSTDVYEEDSFRSMPENLNGLHQLTVQYWFKKNNVEHHPNAHHFFKPRAGLIRFQTVAEGDDSKKSYKRLHRWRYSPTAAYGNNEVHLHPYKSRRLSVAEALAIQSLPPEFSLPESMSLSNMFKTIGNGVPYLASLGIANTVRDFLESIK
ncbi:DNA cytosine methyltransferase [Synechococcus sp. PCC 6312]|uniref:DNA cytosine methyltransferase n=1 Tax=Synechococcus sp. (strain ATCC 27167 / PCC 6312) TaxID=195253 RepID=UPI00029F3269|nr:DNA cytosine methyltransferase [Synechococcus sp. PCC 6312]AFY60915.1 DNA-methyltransferase Dcm [Synechococcus sp. PCC 6312]